MKDSDGVYRRTRLFAMTLGWSRKAVWLLSMSSSATVWSTLHEIDLDAYMVEAGFSKDRLIHDGVTAVVDRDVFPDAADDEGEDYGRKAAWHVIGARK